MAADWTNSADAAQPHGNSPRIAQDFQNRAVTHPYGYLMWGGLLDGVRHRCGSPNLRVQWSPSARLLSMLSVVLRRDAGELRQIEEDS